MPGMRRELDALIRIPSVSGAGRPRETLLEAHALVDRLFLEAGVSTWTLDLPDTAPVVMGEIPAPPGAPTVLLHSQPPFEPVERDGAVFGRGSADTKSNIFAHLGALLAWDGRPPVGTRVVIEGEEEIGGGAFTTYPPKDPDLFAADVMIIGDMGSLRPGVPTLTVGLRGMANVVVEARTLASAKHSGQYGGGGPDEAEFRELSKVTGPFPTSITTQPSVPLLNVNGEPTGSSIQGAVTVPLTPQQEDLAAQPSRLWVQSGQPGDPLLTGTFGAAYSFAAVRCAVDNLNGDNVEWIGMPEGHANVFCYVFLVKQPPAGGKIIVTKKVEAADGTTTVTGTATFTETVSYTPNGEFSLTATSGAPASATFIRDATTGNMAPWTVVERSTPGWRLRSLECVPSGSSTSVTKITNTGGTAGSAAVTLAGGDTVRCTFTNRLTPPRSIIIAKTTRGGGGRFRYTVTPLDGSAPAKATTIRTSTPGVPVAAAPITFAVPGKYRIQERLPSSSGGKWVLTKVVCNGVRQPLPGHGTGVKVTITKTKGAACSFVNTFTPKGRITLRKRTIDGIGTVGFVVTSAANEAFERTQSATTTVSGPAGTVTATGDPLKPIPLGTYVVQETGMAYTPDGYWTLDSVTCNGHPILAVNGRATIALIVAHPWADCTFENRFISTSGVLPPDPPGPGGVVPVADVAISLAVPGPSRGIVRGTRVNYSSVVRNLGPTAAYNVVARFSGPSAVLPATMSASRGGCTGTTIITCRLGTLLPGERVVITASRMVRKLGSFRLTAVVATSTDETTLLNNVDRVPIRVIAPLGVAVPVTG